MNQVTIRFTRKSINANKKESTSYLTHGLFNKLDSFIVLTYYDTELKKKVQIIYNGKNNVIVKSTNKLEFTMGQENLCTYVTDYGSIIVKTTTKYIQWKNNSLMLGYSLYSSNDWIGTFEIKIDILELGLK